MFSSDRLHELEAMMEQHVLLDESSQPIFKKLISDQIMLIRRNGNQYHRDDAMPMSGTTIQWSDHSDHNDAWAAVDVAEEEEYPAVADWGATADWGAEPVADWGAAAEWGVEPVAETADWGAAAEWGAEPVADWGSSSAWDEPVVLENLPELDVEYIAELEYTSDLAAVLYNTIGNYDVYNQLRDRLIRSGMKESLQFKFESKVDVNLEKWSQVKVPGAFQIGIFNFYMRDYLYFDTEKKDFITSSVELKKDKFVKVLRPLQNHPPVGVCKLTSGCSYRYIKDAPVLEAHKEGIKKINLNTKIVDHWNIYNAKCITDADYEIEPYFSKDNNRMVLNYTSGRIDELLDKLPDDDEECTYFYLDGSRTNYGWEGTIHGYHKDLCMSIGQFKMRKVENQ